LEAPEIESVSKDLKCSTMCSRARDDGCRDHGHMQRDAGLVQRWRVFRLPCGRSRARGRANSRGGDIIDVGAESTRPGAASVSASEQLRRAFDVVCYAVSIGACVSIDTSNPQSRMPVWAVARVS